MDSRDRLVSLMFDSCVGETSVAKSALFLS